MNEEENYAPSLPSVRFNSGGGGGKAQQADGGVKSGDEAQQDTAAIQGSQPAAQPRVPQLVSMYNFSARAMLTGAVPTHKVTALTANHNNESPIFYQSVPPRTGPAYSLPEMFSPTSRHHRDHPFDSPAYSSHSKGRTTTRPNVIGLDPRKVLPSGRTRRSHSRGVNGFFPPVKLRGSMQDLDINKKLSRVCITRL